MTKLRIAFSCLFTSLGLATSFAKATKPKPTLEEVRRIWDKASHEGKTSIYLAKVKFGN